MQATWIPLEKIQNILGIESFVVAWMSLIIGFIFYKLFLKKISEKRHFNLRLRFKAVPWFLLTSTILALIQGQLTDQYINEQVFIKVASYVALCSLFMGTIAIIKIAQIYIYLYLFFSNMSHGVPKLLANLFTVIFTLFIANMIASSIFGIHLSALLATSAVFSLVLGLALQDTLGNNRKVMIPQLAIG